jgi:hypothetical protein
MGETEELAQLMLEIERVRRRTPDIATLDLCNRMIRQVQRWSMTHRQVPIVEQEKVLDPLPTESGGEPTEWGKLGISRATYYRRRMEAAEAIEKKES